MLLSPTSTALLLVSSLAGTNALDNVLPTVSECYFGFGSLDFGLNKFENYENYFDANSTVTVAQTGVYEGLEGIEEYVRALGDPSSPFIDAVDTLSTSPPSVSVDDETGICKFTINAIASIRFNEDLTDGGQFNFGSIQNVFFSTVSGKISKIDIYVSEEWVKDYFKTTNKPAETCTVLTGSACGDFNKNNENLTPKQCKKQLKKLKLTEGKPSYVDGNTQGCRTLHSMLALTNSDHCPHLSFQPVEDINGKVKCQKSAKISPTNLFDVDEIAGLEKMCSDSEHIGNTSCQKVVSQYLYCKYYNSLEGGKEGCKGASACKWKKSTGTCHVECKKFSVEKKCIKNTDCRWKAKKNKCLNNE